MSSSQPNQKTPPSSPPALTSETPAELWNRIQESCDALLIHHPEIEKSLPQTPSLVDAVAPLSAIEKWTKAALDTLFQATPALPPPSSAPVSAQNPLQSPVQNPAFSAPPSRSTPPATQTPSHSKAGHEPAFLSDDPRMRAALNRIHEKSVESSKSRLRPGSKLIRPGLEGFHKDEIPVIEASDIKPNANDTSWQQTQAPTTRVLRTPSGTGSIDN